MALLVDGFWLGWLTRSEMHELDAAYYHRLRETGPGEPVDYEGEAYNSRGLWDWELEAVRAHFPPGCRVVVTGAGGGREVLALLGEGFDATGWEPHPVLVEAGARLLAARGHPGRLLASSRDRFPEDAPSAEAVVVGWGSYMLIRGRATRVDFLREARTRLDEGAPVLLSFYAAPAREPHLERLARLATLVRRLRGQEPAEAGDAVGSNFFHVFTAAEVEGELRDAGFDMASFALEPYGHAVGRAVPQSPQGS